MNRHVLMKRDGKASIGILVSTKTHKLSYFKWYWWNFLAKKWKETWIECKSRYLVLRNIRHEVECYMEYLVINEEKMDCVCVYFDFLFYYVSYVRLLWIVEIKIQHGGILLSLNKCRFMLCYCSVICSCGFYWKCCVS